MNRRTKTTIIDLNRKIFWSLIASLIVLFVLYGYFISKSIINVLIREEIAQELVIINSNISNLEFTYLEQKNQINLDFAYSQGFKTVKGKEFVARKSSLSKRLSLNNEI